MGSFNITTSAAEDAVFSEARTLYNAENGTSLTGAQFFDLAIRPQIRAFMEEQIAKSEATNKTNVLTAWQSASQATRDQVKALLGL